MKKERLEYYKMILTDLKNSILEDLDSIEDQHIHHSSAKEYGDSAYPIHLADIADSLTEAELGFKLKNSEEIILAAIDAALKRIEEGTYGICQDCGARISDERLEVMPYAVRCITCKSVYEKNKTK
ncbi:TraR/DksA C4-type zinc finger protein [Candidatus Mcinerneyibacteriota bacterium]|nr:TraR/DksA C4-type zinc finger protein [Candidatus Mcinerneyibacteriota bacterium]